MMMIRLLRVSLQSPSVEYEFWLICSVINICIAIVLHENLFPFIKTGCFVCVSAFFRTVDEESAIIH